MQGEVTRRFIYAYQILRQNGTVPSGRQFALALDYLPQSWNEILQGRRDATLDLLHKAATLYRISPTFLFSGEGDPFFDEHMNEKVRIRTIVVDEKAQEQLVFVPKSAQSVYPFQFSEIQFIENLPTFTIPEFTQTSGTHRSFEVVGDQMEPALFDGERVIGSYLHPERWKNGLRDNHCYVVVTKGEVTIRRVINKLEDQESLVLIADNNYYPPVRVHADEIKEIWLLIQKISPFLHAHTYQEDHMREQIAMLYDQLTEQNKLVMALMKRLNEGNDVEV